MLGDNEMKWLLGRCKVCGGGGGGGWMGVCVDGGEMDVGVPMSHVDYKTW